jgi:hypothetical protein
MVKGFGFDHFVGKSFELARTTIPLKQACLIERMSIKKAKATHRVALRSFGLDQFGGEVVRACENDNPKILVARFCSLLYCFVWLENLFTIKVKSYLFNKNIN